MELGVVVFKHNTDFRLVSIKLTVFRDKWTALFYAFRIFIYSWCAIRVYATLY